MPSKHTHSVLVGSLPLLSLPHIPYIGEGLSLIVAVSWTICALLSETVSRRLGVHVVNLLRMVLSILMIGALLWVATGSPFLPPADSVTWLWLLASGAVGYVFGDYCLFNAYLLIGARLGQLFMTIAPPVAALAGWMLLGECLSWQAWAGILVTTVGIAVSILGRCEKSEISSEKHRSLQLNIPLRGVLLGIGAGVGQGLGLTLSAVGLHHYVAQIKVTPIHGLSTEWQEFLLPFAATQIRAISGLIGFLIILWLTGRGASLGKACRDGKGWLLMAATVFFGPFFGVSLSLMATQYTSTGVAMTLMSLTPILILWPAHALFGQPVSRREILGALVSVLGVSLFFLHL